MSHDDIDIELQELLGDMGVRYGGLGLVPDIPLPEGKPEHNPKDSIFERAAQLEDFCGYSSDEAVKEMKKHPKPSLREAVRILKQMHQESLAKSAPGFIAWVERKLGIGEI